MNKCIIVEGPDGAGKTTLLKMLQTSLGRPVYHTGGPVDSEAMFRKKLELAESHALSHLLDRTPHISEPIYSRASFRKVFLPEHELHERLKGFSPTIVYCRLASIADMFRYIDRSHKVHKSPEHLAEVMQNYKSIVEDYDRTMESLASLGFTVLPYSWESSPITDLVRALS